MVTTNPKMCTFFLTSCSKFENAVFFRYPFDWKNPLGYLVAVTLQYIIIFHVFLLIFSAFSLGVGCFLLVISIMNQSMKSDLKLFNANAASDQNHLLTVKLVADFVEIHSFLKKLSVCSV